MKLIDKDALVAEIEILKLCTMDEHMAFYNDKAKEDYRFLSEIEEIIKGMQEEPVCEDLGYYINELSKQFQEVSFSKLSRIAVRVAKWQKKQDQSTIELAEDHAMLAGMEKMKEEIMAKAVEVTVHIDAGNYPYIQQLELYDYDKNVPLAKEGDKYKVVLIKEDEL